MARVNAEEYIEIMKAHAEELLVQGLNELEER